MTLENIVYHYQWHTKITFIRGGLSYVQQSAEKASLSVVQNSLLRSWYLLPRRLQRTTQVPYNTVPEDYLVARSFFMALF